MQLDLLPAQKPTVTTDDVNLLLSCLADGAWHTAGQLAHQLPINNRYPGAVTSILERKIRAIANASDGQILSYPGSPGYKLTKLATVAEIQIATEKIRHQAKEMQHRALTIDRVYHGKH